MGTYQGNHEEDAAGVSPTTLSTGLVVGEQTHGDSLSLEAGESVTDASRETLCRGIGIPDITFKSVLHFAAAPRHPTSSTKVCSSPRWSAGDGGDVGGCWIMTDDAQSSGRTTRRHSGHRGRIPVTEDAFRPSDLCSDSRMFYLNNALDNGTPVGPISTRHLQYPYPKCIYPW